VVQDHGPAVQPNELGAGVVRVARGSNLPREIGRSLAQRLMDRMNGILGLEPSEDGARFFIEVPISPTLPAMPQTTSPNRYARTFD
jgi:hypothetical protein